MKLSDDEFDNRETHASPTDGHRTPRGVIVLPTFNEALNLPHLVPRLLQQPGVDILIVDDGSPDGTGDLAEELAREHAPRVSVIHRTTKSGRGGAVMAGFRAALDLDYTWFGEMDADQSHQPEELPALREAIEHADMVVGARYLTGGEIHGGHAGGAVEPRIELHHPRNVGSADA